MYPGGQLSGGLQSTGRMFLHHWYHGIGKVGIQWVRGCIPLNKW